MSATLLNWSMKGFGSPPTLKTAPQNGVQVYRCWGGHSKEESESNLKGGFFSLEKPSSVSDAELRFKIAEWGNRIWFVSTFRILPSVTYWEGAIFHHKADLRRPATQIFVEPPVNTKVQLLISKEVLKQDVHVLSTGGNA